ncbi:MAG TPA: DMT family transporter [Spirochaetia bacterium]|nr:DMT family transporter [Spirochaetia bacterium]
MTASITAPERRGRALVALTACALLWSTGGLLIKMVDWNPFALAGARSLIGGLLVLAVLRRPRFTWSFAQLAGAVCYAGCMVLFVLANKMTTAANAILLQYTAPIYAAVFGWVLLREKPTLVDWTTIAVVLGGMVLFFLDRLGRGGMAGNLVAIASGVFFAGSMVALRRQKDGSPLESLLLSHAITFVVSIPFLWGPAPNLRSVVGIAFLGIFQIGIPSFLLTYGVKRVTALQTLLTSVLEPIFNPIWVFLFLGEAPGPRALAGGAIIVVAVTVRSVISLRLAGLPAVGASRVSRLPK